MLKFGYNSESIFKKANINISGIYEARHCLTYKLWNITKISKEYKVPLHIDLLAINSRYLELQKNINLFSYLSYNEIESVYWHRNATEYLITKNKDEYNELEKVMYLLVCINIDIFEEIIKNLKQKKIEALDKKKEFEEKKPKNKLVQRNEGRIRRSYSHILERLQATEERLIQDQHSFDNNIHHTNIQYARNTLNSLRSFIETDEFEELSQDLENSEDSLYIPRVQPQTTNNPNPNNTIVIEEYNYDTDDDLELT